MLDLKLDTNIPEKAGKLALLTDLQLRYAVAQAMTDAAKAGQQAITNSMSRYIDRPTPFTQNSTYVSFANPNRMHAEVGFRQFAAKGTPAGEYLSAMAKGGDRPPKPGERLLRSRGLIQGGQFIVPNREAENAALVVDSYGNVPKGTYSRMYSQLRSYSGIGSLQNATGSARSRRKRKTFGQFFLSGSRRAILYRAPDSREVETAFIVLDDAPNHEKRFPIVDILNQEVARTYPQLIRSSLERELRRAGFG